jgi:hypothetical protein
MDLSIYMSIITSAAWYLIPIFIFTTLIKSAWFKGVMGEWQVNMLIKFFLDKNQYHLIKNVTLPTFIDDKEHGTTQIDHIIVSKYGVFVIETKNMKGWIFGSVNQKQWTQKIFKHTSKFQNPIHQNYKHIKTLETYLQIPSHCIFSVIIFIGNSTFKTKMPENVCFAKGGINYIKNQTTIVFNTEEITTILAQIESGRLTRSFKTDRQHVKHVKEIIQEKANTKTCARCGSDMKIRKATKGKNTGNEFWGCSNFPKCRFVIEIG